ncbi:hypothetical protein BRIN106911_23465 [Brevibacillus invocatus]
MVNGGELAGLATVFIVYSEGKLSRFLVVAGKLLVGM